MNEEQLVQLFADAARLHTGVNWFAHGAQDFTFAPQADIQFPMVFAQSTGASAGDNRITYNFTIYSLVVPLPSPELDETGFQWDDTAVEARDTALQILKDIVGRVRLQNQQDFTLTHTGWTSDGDRLIDDYNAVGWRTDITIEMDFVQNNANFPS